MILFYQPDEWYHQWQENVISFRSIHLSNYYNSHVIPKHFQADEPNSGKFISKLLEKNITKKLKFLEMFLENRNILKVC